MFDALTGRLSDVFDKLKKRGALKEGDINAAMAEIRLALLEADVALLVVKDFIKEVSIKALGHEVLKSISPGQQIVKIVNDVLIDILGADNQGLNLLGEPPTAIMMVGLQGSGKTTSSAKIALRLKTRNKKKVIMASLDVARPAAQEQLKILGEQIDVATLPIVAGQQPVDIAKRAMQAGRLGGYDVVMLDTAGRMHVDDALMGEASAVVGAVKPQEIILVADAMTGQDALNVANSFHKRVNLTGIMLTRIDGDARGGAALSMRKATGCPIKFLGVGEKLEELEEFHADRIASRILGMGDVVSLVEKAQENIDEEEAAKLAKKMEKGLFDLDDMAGQLKQMRNMGGMEGVMSMLPGVGKMKQQMANANIDPKMLIRQEAIISSMTKKEKKNPKIIHANRKKRIAAGSGTNVQEVNKLLKQFMTMAKMMKKVSKMGQKGFMRSLGGMLPPNMMPPGGGGGMR